MIAVVLMIFSKAAKVSSPPFLVGSIVGLLGAVSILLGIKQWQSRPKPGEQAATPGWMSAMDDFTAAKAFGVGVLLSGVNLKNLGLTIAATASIGSGSLSSGDELVVCVVLGAEVLGGDISIVA